MIDFREIRNDELETVAELLTESFKGYSFFEMYLDNKEKQYKFLRTIQEVAVKAAYKKHIMLVGVQDSKIVSVAQLKASNTSDISLIDYILAGGIKILLTGGIRNTFGFIKMVEEANSICHKLPGCVWYLSSLAVSSSCQGQGLGSMMFEDCIIPYIQRRGGGLLTLITNSQRNRVFYKKNGFEEFHEMIISRNGKELGNWSYRMKIDKKK